MSRTYKAFLAGAVVLGGLGIGLVLLILLSLEEGFDLYHPPPPNSVNPVWSPEGDRLAFDSDRARGAWPWQVFRMNADGSNETQLTSGGPNSGWDAESYYPQWSPDGKRILFTTFTGNRGVAVMNADGSDQRRLTPRRSINYHPAWSPDGNRIAFVSRRDGNPEIYVMNADGRNQRRLTFEERADAAPLWSPDGTGIAFVSTRSGDWDTYVMAANGRSPRRLLRSRSAGIHPVWSPSGSEIALVVDGGDRWELRIVRPDGSGERQLSATATGAGWSPDGRRIAFCRDGAVWVINADGTHRRHLTDPKARYSEDEGCDLGIDESPAWSPDGKQIAYVGTRSGEIQPDLTPEYTKRDIYVIDPERGGEQRLTG